MISNLRTPQEFIDFYWNELQDYFASKNIQISKLGFIGYFLHILGFTQYDVKQYFDGLFKESFPVTAQNITNLQFHAAVYGYIPPIAEYAHLVGDIEYVLYALPIKPPNVIKREIYLNDIQLKIDDIDYQLESKYQIIESIDNSGFLLNVLMKDSQYVSTGFSSISAKSPIFDLNQVTNQTVEFTTPNYNYSTYYYKIIEITQNQLAGLEIYVNNLKYDIEYIKSFKSGDDKVVFIRYLNNKLIIEFGSGIHGKYVPNTSIKVLLSLTRGKIGNIGKGRYIPTAGTVSVIDTFVDNTISDTYTFQASSFIRFNVLYGIGGDDLFDSDTLRTKLLEYIRHRKNLVSERDFRTIFSDYMTDFDLLFKKIDIRDNNIYNHFLIYDNYMIPYNLDCITPKLSEIVPDSYLDSTTPVVVYPEFSQYNKTYVSPFLYVYNNLFQMYEGYILYPEYNSYFDKTTIHLSNITIPPLSFQIVYNANTFRVFIKSYQNLDNYIIRMYIPSKSLDVNMNRLNENIKYYDIDFFINALDFIFDVLHLGTSIATLELNNVLCVLNLTDYISVKKYIPDFTTMKQVITTDTTTVVYYREPNDTEVYLVNFPVIEKSQFFADQKLITDKITTLFTNIYAPGNRMISDDVQIKFLSSHIINKNILKLSTIQQLEFDLSLPLRIEIDIYVNRPSIIDDTINIRDKTENLKFEVAQLLKDKYTGIQISFYKSQIIDFIHNINWVKHCDIRIYDNNNIRIIDDNIESYTNFETLKKISDKFTATKFIPIFWWWDLNNIKIDLYFDQI